MKKLPIFCGLLLLLLVGVCANPRPSAAELRPRPAITSGSGQQVTIAEVRESANQLDD